MRINIHTAYDVNNMLWDVKLSFDSFSIPIYINLQRYQTYRCTDKLIGTNCTPKITRNRPADTSFHECQHLLIPSNKPLKKSLESFFTFFFPYLFFSFIQFLFARYMKSITWHVSSSLKWHHPGHNRMMLGCIIPLNRQIGLKVKVTKLPSFWIQ